LTLPIWIVDAFAEAAFAGNPAAVCLVDAFPDPALMQAVAAENNLSETAFVVRDGPLWRIRWFTPAAEVPLCGHATLAAAWVVFEQVETTARSLSFECLSGRLSARRCGRDIVLDFPARPPTGEADPEAVSAALGVSPESCWLAPGNHLAVLASAAALRALTPDMARVAELGGTGLIATAPGDDADFVSRYFAPAVGVGEDPVTGSAHCTLGPFWAERLGKSNLVGYQASERGGVVYVEVRDDRVVLGGHAVTVLRGEWVG